MTYRELRPSPALAPYVDCYWTRVSVAPTSQRVLPDGAVDILFEDDREPFVVGTMTRPLVASRSGPTRIVAVRFRPGGAYPFLSLPMGELTDRHVELRDVWRSPEPVGSVAALDAWLLRRLATIAAPDARVAAAVAHIEATGGRTRVSELCRRLGWTRQHVNRLFERHVGVSVKFFSRVVRFQQVVARPERDWASLAVDHGYYDQAHLISEFHALAGLTPAKFHFSNTERGATD